MAPEPAPITLTIPSDLRLLPIVCGFVEAICHVGGLDSTATNAVVLATNEAVNNVIRHAHRDHPEAQIQIECRFDPAGLEVCLLDEGEPFNLGAVPHLDPAELRCGGRGVFLMRTLMDELNCRPRGLRGNTLRMIKRCPRTPPAAPSANSA